MSSTCEGTPLVCSGGTAPINRVEKDESAGEGVREAAGMEREERRGEKENDKERKRSQGGGEGEKEKEGRRELFY
jgi:hypothetical protein